MAITQGAKVEIQTYPTNRLFCWHGRKHLRVLMSSNGGQVFCEKCHRNRFGFLEREDQE